MNSLGLYIHIPFCKSKCLYCDFNSFAKRERDIEPYFSVLKKEISAWAKDLGERPVDTIYFGGGTPSYAGTEKLCDIIRAVKEKFVVLDDAEITVECNPGTIDIDGFNTLKKNGVNRLSIGLQSTCDDMLKKMGRIHNVSQFEKCFLDARQAGFENISLDLMYGLPDMTIRDWEKTLDKAIAFDAEHISAYALKIEDGTPFSKIKLNLPDEDLCADMYELLVEKLRKAGYQRYEISNFAKKSFAARHNQKYWEYADFLGLGAGAYSFVDGVRFSNCTDILDYVKRVECDGKAVKSWEKISKNEQMSEFVFLGLRCEKGISLKDFEERFGIKLLEKFGKPIKKYIDLGFLALEDGYLSFYDKGFFVSNIILSDFV